MPPRESPRVNLDALIQRQDMSGGEPKPVPRNFAFAHTELVSGSLTFTILRKPDFQRATSSWTPEKVRDMVVAYVNDETIPGLIVWRSPQNDLFIIDGAHRLSSLIAWVNDDYGDGVLSQSYFGEKQHPTTADKTRTLVNDAVGKYSKVLEADSSSSATDIEKTTAKKLPFCELPVQALKTTDLDVAERSFFKINEQGVVLSATEKWMLHSRRCPNSIAARAISQRGQGNAYWGRFGSSRQAEIAQNAKEVYELLFTPVREPGTLKTSNVPIAGEFVATNALNLVFQFVNFANDVKDKTPKSREEAEAIVPPDQTGERTVEFLKRAKRLASLLSNSYTSNHRHSLDLHPFVYFYSADGNHQPSAFLAVAKWLHDYDANDKIAAFLLVRARVEDFLLSNRFLIPAITRKARGEEKGVIRVKNYLDFVVNYFAKPPTGKGLLEDVAERFKVLAIPEPNDEEFPRNSGFSVATKNAEFVSKELAKSELCNECEARVADHALSADHDKDRKFGGQSIAGNHVPTHHTCNGSKDKMKALRVSI